MKLPRDQVKDNLLGFEVYYRDMVEEQIINEIAYNPIDLFCDIGGALGLILGASISTVLEFIDYCIRQKYKSRKTNPNPVT